MDIRLDALPKPLRSLPTEELIARFQAGIQKTLTRVQANPRCAVPHFFRDKTSGKGELQLLLPINMDYKLEADCAITIHLDKNNTEWCYNVSLYSVVD
jgi:hypothetical protein